MATYAALTSLNNLIHEIQNHPSPPISIEKQQLDSLTEIVTLLQEFLEGYNSPVADGNEADPLEMRIADAAYAAQDVIESNIVDAIKAPRFTITHHQESQGEQFQGLQKVITDMNLIKKEIEKEKTTVEAQLQRNHVSASAASPRSSIVVGIEDVSLQIMDKLTAGQHCRQVIPIVGMGGIGKTTLARNVYTHSCIKYHFDVRVWATISQTYNTKEILCDLLSQANKKSKEQLSNMSEQELQLEVYKHLFGRRFLIVLDDMWSIDAWDKMQHFFPDNGNRSRIVVTTRLSTLGYQLENGYSLKMKFLDDDSSWKLFLKTVFGEESCPTQLEEIGKKIVETCRGLPLSIVVMGGLLKKLQHTQECWESMRRNSSSVLNSENEDSCLKILKMSYNHLPMYLKPCFLYMGVFEEDRAVRVSMLVKLWVSEGFLKPVSGKSLETAAKEYLNDLVERNLVLVHELGSTGNIKHCKIHDLLRDLCWRVAGKEGFYYVIGQHKFQGLNRQRHVVIRGSSWKEEVGDTLPSMPLARSFLCGSKEVVPLPKSRMLRVLKTYDRDTSGSHDYWFNDLIRFVDSRYLAVGVRGESKFHSSVSLLWNLHTLIIFHSSLVLAPDEIWMMPQLRHVEFHKGVLDLPNPPSGSTVIMENLQTLKGLSHLDCDDASKIIPNIRKLGVEEGTPNNLICLSNLESFRCWGDKSHFKKYCNFPCSLKKLSLGSNSSHWKMNNKMLEKIGALPHLQKLKLERAEFHGSKWKEWETSEDRFPSLKYLGLKWCLLKSWRTESSHFPRLEQLHLCGLKELEEIPCEIGEIATLQSIVLEYCSEAAVVSAKNITEEQEDLRVRVVLFNNNKNQLLRTLTSTNFVVETVDF